MNTIIDALNWRYATKKFDTNKKISQDDIDILLEALRLSPSSFGLQARKFIHVKNPETRKALQNVSREQPQITEASDLIIIASKTAIQESDVDEYMENIKECRQGDNKENLPSLQSFKERILGTTSQRTAEQIKGWNQRQAYIAMGVLLTVCASMKIDACPMEGFDPVKYNEILGLNELGLTATVVIPVGYRSSEDSYANLSKVRFSKEKLIIQK